jgi:tetratricopeptide (TPR) repeat protein
MIAARRLTKSIFAVATTLVLALAVAPLAAQQLGTITFPNSGAPAAQTKFLDGVKFLHSFQFDEAAVAFQEAQKADPNFALAYWGEAMSHNHPLWAQVDVPKAKAILEKLGATPQARLAKAPTEKEKAYLSAIELLYYSPGDKLARDQAYSDALAKMYAQYPNDHEVAIFYALSLLGTVRPGDEGYKRQALAASISLKVFEQNPKHPGAAHFIIHSFDDPDHAILALPAAREYAAIAPSAGHALHMPSHIFVQLGMWPDVAASNTVAFKAATETIARMKLPEGRDDFHALSWLEYANLMMGKFDEAKANVATAKATADRNPNAANIRQGYLNMRARYILESAQWEKIELAELPGPPATAVGGPAGGMTGPNYGGRATWIFITGFSAAKLGDFPTAEKAAAQLRTIRERMESSGNAFAAKSPAIMEKEVAAAIHLARNQRDEAIRLAKEAADIELTMDAPSGPPDPIKPAVEFYGEVLLEAGRAAEAKDAFEHSLQRMPNRTPSVRGLSRAGGSVTPGSTISPSPSAGSSAAAPAHAH